MKGFFLLLIFLSSRMIAFSNSLHSLVFDFSSNLKTSLPQDGWVKVDFSVVNFGEKEILVQFSATCVETGMSLSYYPQSATFSLKPNVEQTITVFINAQCGMLDDLLAGRYSRSVQFNFFDQNTKDELTFDQQYIIEVPQNFTEK